MSWLTEAAALNSMVAALVSLSAGGKTVQREEANLSPTAYCSKTTSFTHKLTPNIPNHSQRP